ncbi:MAG: hypothetical protein WCB57_07495 [Pseudonocardiaceae bacterium]
MTSSSATPTGAERAAAAAAESAAAYRKYVLEPAAARAAAQQAAPEQAVPDRMLPRESVVAQDSGAVEPAASSGDDWPGLAFECLVGGLLGFILERLLDGWIRVAKNVVCSK